MMNSKPVKTKKDYKQAPGLRKTLIQRRESCQGDEREIWGILIEKYEEENLPNELPDPIEAIKLKMGYNQSGLADIIGPKSRVSEVLNRKRKLSLSMIRRLHEKLYRLRF